MSFYCANCGASLVVAGGRCGKCATHPDARRCPHGRTVNELCARCTPMPDPRVLTLDEDTLGAWTLGKGVDGDGYHITLPGDAGDLRRAVAWLLRREGFGK